MAEQAENERPFAFKRERRQSRGFQDLIEQEPVSKSPFKVTPAQNQSPVQSSSKPATSSPLTRDPMPTFNISPPPNPPSDSHVAETPVSPVNNTTPTRSSLVSRRMHGPRSSGSPRDGFGSRRSRRKTVHFDEQCDVVEFEPEEEEEEEGTDVADDDEIENSGSTEYENATSEVLPDEPDDSYEGVPLDVERSLSFESILNATRSSPGAQSPPTSAFSFSLPAKAESTRPPTPPPSRFQPVSTRDGTPVDDAISEQDSSYHGLSLDDRHVETGSTIPVQSTPPSTPPRSRRLAAIERKPAVRKSTHADRVRTTPDKSDAERDINMLPSPKPIKGRKKPSGSFDGSDITNRLEVDGSNDRGNLVYYAYFLAAD